MTGEQRKAAIVDFIADFFRTRGFYPSVREIAAGVGLKSASLTHEHLVQLVSERRLERRQVGTKRFVWAIPEGGKAA